MTTADILVGAIIIFALGAGLGYYVAPLLFG